MTDAARPYDLVIVGASFAGLVAARTAAMRGLSVAVLEAKPEAGHRVATTGILVKEAAEEIDIPHGLTRRVHGVRLYAPNHQHIDLFAPGFVASQYRWAALRLRKASRDLVDEAKKYHFMFTKRDFKKFEPWSRFKPSRIAGESGIYLLRGGNKQPLYIGRAADLGARLDTHAECRAINDVVQHVAFLTGDELPGQEYQDALKEDLVRRYVPKWNVNLVGLVTSD